jgi:oligopeptide/dipeptide ABC transporter ATP-binding protein
VTTIDDETPLLAIEDLRVTFDTDAGEAVTVDGLSLEVREGEVLGIVGESGSGKSMTSMAILGLLPRAARVSGSVRFRGRELVGLADDDYRELRGNEIAMVFQDALAALNPVMTVGAQLEEAVRVHRPDLDRAALRRRAVELLELVGIPSAASRVDRYPHEYSGGMRQRVVIAMSVANEPALLIADEPTTALDVTVQAQVLDVLRTVQERTGTAVLLITHDLGVVAGVADRVLVMYAGDRVEEAPVDDLFHAAGHPYTRGLLASLPRIDRRDGDRRLFQIEGQPPSSTQLPPGCRFAPRCPDHRSEVCDATVPGAVPVAASHVVACHRVGDVEEVIS